MAELSDTTIILPDNADERMERLLDKIGIPSIFAASIAQRIDLNKDGILDDAEAEALMPKIKSRVESFSAEKKEAILAELDPSKPNIFRNQNGKIPLLQLEISQETADHIIKTIREAASTPSLNITPLLQGEIRKERDILHKNGAITADNDYLNNRIITTKPNKTAVFV